MIEKRRFVRLDAEVEVNYAPVKGIALEAAKSKNISVGGIRILLNQKFAPGTQLNLEIRLPGEAQPLKIIGEVVWQQEIENGGLDTGIRYVKVFHADMYKITRYLIAHLNDTSKPDQTARQDQGSFIDILTREFRLPGDASPVISAPDFLVHEIRLPGDKTRYARIMSSVAVGYKRLDGEDNAGKTYSQYISGGDVWFLLDKCLPIGIALEITFEFPKYGRVVASGEVVICQGALMCDDEKKRMFYETNLRFTELSAEGWRKIIRYVYDCRTDYVMIGKCPPGGWMPL